MNLNSRITGPAGAGVNSTVDIIAEIFSFQGYNFITDIEYESRIKGGINYFDINLSLKGECFLTKEVDVIIALNAESLKAQLAFLKDKGLIISNIKYINKLEENGTSLDNFNILPIETNDKYDNTYLIAIFLKYLGIPIENVLPVIRKIFEKKGEDIIKYNKEIIELIYRDYKIDLDSKLDLPYGLDQKKLTYGNKAIALGAIEGGLEFYSAYPMTPASSILTEIINDSRINYIQNEDEIAVIMSALGASFTGARAMVGTSGGGFALMTEGISFAVQAEIPITMVLSQRAGPSTGTPTYHEAGDINFALNPSFGDFNHVVLYPSNINEAYYFSGLALNIADKYQVPVIILTDKQASEMLSSAGNLQSPAIDRGEVLENPGEDYKRYENTINGISPRVKVGTKNGDFIASSYEHDEYGATTENSEIKVMMTEKRWKKLDNFYNKEGYKGYEVINKDAKKMLIVSSFTSYTAKKFVENNKDFGIIIIKFLKPLDIRLLDEIKDKEELIFVENNYSGQIQNYITKELGLNFIHNLKISHMRKYDLFPFYIEDFNELIK